MGGTADTTITHGGCAQDECHANQTWKFLSYVILSSTVWLGRVPVQTRDLLHGGETHNHSIGKCEWWWQRAAGGGD